MADKYFMIKCINRNLAVCEEDERGYERKINS